MSMIGVHSIITGLRPELALETMQQDIDRFTSIPKMSTVKDALYALDLNKK